MPFHCVIHRETTTTLRFNNTCFPSSLVLCFWFRANFYNTASLISSNPTAHSDFSHFPLAPRGRWYNHFSNMFQTNCITPSIAIRGSCSFSTNPPSNLQIHSIMMVSQTSFPTSTKAHQIPIWDQHVVTNWTGPSKSFRDSCTFSIGNLLIYRY